MHKVGNSFFSSFINFFRFLPQRRVANKYASGAVGLFDAMAKLGGYGYDGDRFMGGFGLTKDLRVVDLATLQMRSMQLFRENTYANIVFTRLITITINKGLSLESAPSYDILSRVFGLKEDDLEGWASQMEALWEAYTGDPKLIDRRRSQNFGALQKQVKTTAMISGDCLVIWSLNKLGLPEIELVDGINVRSPLTGDFPEATGVIKQGVELDQSGREIAYYVKVKDIKTGLYKMRRVLAYARNGQRRARLIKATAGRIDEVRGVPLLSCILQSLKAWGNSLDSEERAMLINSYVVMTHKQDNTRTLKDDPIQGILKNIKNIQEDKSDDGKTNEFNAMGPGIIMRNLAENETVESYDTSRPNRDVADFVNLLLKAGIQSLGYSPEVILSDYNSSFSASRQAKNDTNEKVQEENAGFSNDFCKPTYTLFVDGMVLSDRVPTVGYFEAMKDISLFHIRNGWLRSSWRGLPNISVDPLKQAKAYKIFIEAGLMNHKEVSAQLGSDFDRNVRILKKSNEKLVDAYSVIPEKSTVENPLVDDGSRAKLSDKVEDLEEAIEELIQC